MKQIKPLEPIILQFRLGPLVVQNSQTSPLTSEGPHVHSEFRYPQECFNRVSFACCANNKYTPMPAATFKWIPYHWQWLPFIKLFYF